MGEKNNKIGVSERLSILLLLKLGAKQVEIAKAIGMDQGDLSRMFPARKFKPLAFLNKEEK